MASIHTIRYEKLCKESKLRRETLQGIQSSDERARGIWTNALSVIKYSDQVKQQTSAHMIDKYNDAIANCKRSIKEGLSRLNADENFIKTFMEFIDNKDADNALLQLIRLLIKRNPGLYRRQLAVCESKVLQK